MARRRTPQTYRCPKCGLTYVSPMAVTGVWCDRTNKHPTRVGRVAMTPVPTEGLDRTA